ncbi:MAG: hypothetical protein HRT89_12280 [Lentisphaeria bacterium]|nr:hypothetical protein [Lentisphaeria bacterium]NQZ68834.1 hypothetical protein [Lentisphaeria bacterium]
MAFRETNSEGKPIIKLTDAERYEFDLKGWLVVPGVLDEDEIPPMLEHARKLKFELDTVEPKYHTTISGPLEALCDHPRVVGFMQEFLGSEGLGSEGDDGGYSFRMEYSFMGWRLRSIARDGWSPHAGKSPTPRRGHDHLLNYHSTPGNAFSGFVQAVWELNPVEYGHGTHFLSGSHKACFERPDEVTEDRKHPLWGTYECPAGSIVFFSETTCHSGAKWDNQHHDRCAIFNTYNSVFCRYHNWEPHDDHLAEMNPVRRSLFRPICVEWNTMGQDVPEDVATPRRGF